MKFMFFDKRKQLRKKPAIGFEKSGACRPVEIKQLTILKLLENKKENDYWDKKLWKKEL